MKPSTEWWNTTEDEQCRQMLEPYIERAHDELGLDAVEFLELLQSDVVELLALVFEYPEHLRRHALRAIDRPQLVPQALPIFVALLAAEYRVRSAMLEVAARQRLEARHAIGHWYEMPVNRHKAPGQAPRESRIEALADDADRND